MMLTGDKKEEEAGGLGVALGAMGALQKRNREIAQARDAVTVGQEIGGNPLNDYVRKSNLNTVLLLHFFRI